MNKIRVVHMLCSNSYSGAENVVCQIVNMFKEDATYEFVYASPDGRIRDALEKRRILFAPMKDATLSEFKRVIKEINPSIVHAHDMRASFLAALACGNIPMISHVHNNNFDSQKPTIKAFLYRYAAIKAKHIFWVSQSSFDGYFFHKGLGKKSTVLYNVIDANQLVERANEAPLQTPYDIVYVGRLTYQKNPQRLINVLGSIVSQKPEVKCALIGTGDLEEEVKGLIKIKKLENNIDFLGFQSNPYGILKNAKIMIMTSRWEGTPMCALEAMALGIPIVSTPTDGLKELVDNGITGFLDDEDSKIRDDCVRIVLDDEMRNNFSNATLQKSRQMMELKKYHHQLKQIYTKYAR